MSKVKKIIGGLLEGGVEVVKDSARQLADTVSPVKIIEQAIGQPKSEGSEVTQYLKDLSGSLSEEEIEKKKKELGEKEQQELEEARKSIQSAVPEHMRLRKEKKEPSIYEQNVQEEERKKALAVEAQKKQQAQSSFPPSGKKQRGSLFAKKKRPKTADFERSKNIKIG